MHFLPNTPNCPDAGAYAIAIELYSILAIHSIFAKDIENIPSTAAIEAGLLKSEAALFGIVVAAFPIAAARACVCTLRNWYPVCASLTWANKLPTKKAKIKIIELANFILNMHNTFANVASSK